jgi:hypothetical protein
MLLSAMLLSQPSMAEWPPQAKIDASVQRLWTHLDADWITCRDLGVERFKPFCANTPLPVDEMRSRLEDMPGWRPLGRWTETRQGVSRLFLVETEGGPVAIGVVRGVFAALAGKSDGNIVLLASDPDSLLASSTSPPNR